MTGYAKDLEHFQTQTIKKLIGCPRNTPPALARLFCGVEPLTCRLETLNLRYYWKTLHSPPDSITHRILKYRKQNLLVFDKGFGHQVFNTCCKYNAISIWHGIVPEKLNPLRSIKKIIISKNLRNDLEVGRPHTCSFATIFLSNLFTYQKNYHLVEPLSKLDYSSNLNESQIYKALLDSCSYQKDCKHCGLQVHDLLTHFLTQCPALSEIRRLLQLKLLLYNFPNEDSPPQKNLLLKLALNNACWRKCVAKFLKDCDY